jgi:hypothetical protein
MLLIGFGAWVLNLHFQLGDRAPGMLGALMSFATSLLGIMVMSSVLIAWTYGLVKYVKVSRMSRLQKTSFDSAIESLVDRATSRDR